MVAHSDDEKPAPPQQRLYSNGRLQTEPLVVEFTSSAQDQSRPMPTNPDAEPASKTTSSTHRPQRPSQSFSPQPTPSLTATVRKSRTEFKGKDWESYQAGNPDKLDPTPPGQQNPEHGVPTRDGEELQEQSTAPFSISTIQPKVVSRSKPTTLLSPISLATHSPETTDESEASSRPLTPELGGVPKFESAFAYAMRPFFDDESKRRLALLSPTLAGESSRCSSPLLPPRRDDQISCAGSAKDMIEGDSPEYGFPAHLKVKGSFRLRMLHIHLRTLLMRCTVLQATVRDLERKPWAQDMQRSPSRYYSKMRYLAQKARRIAEALESRDLLARCEYWTGRACGGTRDYQAAAEHFKLATKFDVENDTHPSGKIRLRGLRPNEKADVHFLLDSVMKRHEEGEQKTADAKIVAKYESDQTGKPLDDCIDRSALQSPLWAPDRDRIMQLARQEFGIKKRLGKRDKVVDHLEQARFGQEPEGKVKAQWDAESVDEVEMTRRVLTEKEWRYIYHGDEKDAELRVRRDDAAKAVTPRPREGKQQPRQKPGSIAPSLSSGASKTLSNKSSPHSKPTLEDELAQAGWNSVSPSAPHTPSRTPSPVRGLAERRNVTLEPIDTEHVQKRTSIGEVVQADCGEDSITSPTSTLGGADQDGGE